MFFCLNKDENLFSFLVFHIIFCVYSLLKSLVPVFSQYRMVDFGPSCLLVTTASDMTCQQLQSYPNTPCSQKSQILLLPLIGPQSGAPSLHTKPLPSPPQPITDSVTPIYPPTLCRVANELESRGTPFSQTLVFLSCLV